MKPVLLALVLLFGLGLTSTPIEAAISYQSVRCGEDHDVYGRVNFPAGTPSFSLYLQARVPSQNNAGTEWIPVINSNDNVAPAPTDTSADFGPLDTANVPASADRIRVVNTLNNNRSDPIIPCDRPYTPVPTATATATATSTPAPTQTPVILIATATATPQPPSAPPVIVNVLPALPQAPAAVAPASTAPGTGGQISPPRTGSRGLLP